MNTRRSTVRTLVTMLATVAVAGAMLGVVAALLVQHDGGPRAPGSPPTPFSGPADTEASTEPQRIGKPVRVQIPAIGVDADVVEVGLLADGAMETPGAGLVGWYRPGPRPGARGPSVMVGHVHYTQGDDVFADLARLRPGDVVTVHGTKGSVSFVIEGLEDVAKERLPYDRIWNGADEPLLRLITCAGEPDPVTRVYPDNTVVYARTR